jgi:hypothetical protein
MTDRNPTPGEVAAMPNGDALAAMLAAAIGALALGVLVILNEAGIFSAPALYAPAGGLSGRATMTMIGWLGAWGVLHARWRRRQVAAAPVFTWIVVLIAIAVFMTFPPVWGLLPSNP